MYKRNYKRESEAAKSRAIRNREYVNGYLADKSCLKCGLSNLLVLEFDHLDPSKKDKGISDMVCNGYSIKRLDTEMRKCQILCRNCHKHKTYSTLDLRITSILKKGISKIETKRSDNLTRYTREHRRMRQDENRLWVHNYLLRHPCKACGEEDPMVLEFDHREPESKLDSISIMVKNGVPLDKLKQEILKCDVLCGNCHLIKTYKERL